MKARFVLACALLSVLALVGETGDQWWGHVPGPQPPLRVTGTVPGLPEVARPTPQAMRPAAAAPSAPACDDRNPRDTLRPLSPMPSPGHMPPGSTMATIAQRGALVVGILEDTFPLAFRNERLQPQGFEIDIARDIAGAILGDPARVVFRPVREADRFTSETAGSMDLVIAAATITCERRKLVDFSAVYYEAQQRLLVNRGSGVKNLADLGHERVCAPLGSTSMQKILSAPTRPTAVGAAIATDCLMMLQLGEVDAVSTDDTLLAGMQAQDSRTEIVGPPLNQEPYGIAINKNTPDLVRFVNGVLERRARDGRWQASYRTWLKALDPPPTPPTAQYRD